MATYTKTTDFLAKDSLPLNNSAKYVKGSEIDTEYNNIATADADNMKKSAMGTGVETFLGTPSSANLAAAVTNETGSGSLVFGTSPTLTTPTVVGGSYVGAQALGNNNITGIKTATFNGEGTIAGTTGAQTVDWTAAQNYKQTEPTGAITYTFTAPPGVCHLQLRILSDGTSTAYTHVWPASVKWLGSTWAAATNKNAVINFWYDGTDYWAMGANEPLIMATGNGITDDTAAIQAAVTAAREVFFPSGTYKITSAISVPSNTTIRCDANVTFDSSSVAGDFQLFYAAGSFGTPYSLTANAALGEVSLTLDALDAANFAAGDWIQIYSSTIYDAGWTSAPIGEMVQVDSVAGTSVILKSPLAGGPYNTADTAKIRKVNFVENVKFFGGSFLGNSTPTVSHIAVRYEVAYNCHVEGTKAQYCNGTAFAMYDAVFCSVSKVHVEDALRTGSGYGVDFTNSSQDCTCTDSVFMRVRHAVTNGLTSGGKGVTRRITHQNLKCYNTINTGDAFDTHANAEDIQFINCISFDSSSIGFNLECGSATLVGCRSIRAAASGFAFTGGTTIKPSEFSATDCFSDYAGGYAFRLGYGSTLNSSETKKITLSNCTANNATGSGLFLQGSASMLMKNAVVNGGYFSGANSNAGGCYVDDYVNGFILNGAEFVSNLANSTAIQINGTNIANGVVSNNLLRFTTTASGGDAILVRKCANINISGNSAVQTPGGGYGLRVIESATNIYEKGNNFALMNVPGVGYISGLTIAAGVLTLPHGGNGIIVADTEASAATDDLDTISGGVVGQVITLQQTSSSRDIVVKDDTGNLRLAGDFTLNNLNDSITLIFNGTAWVETSRADVA